MARNQYPADQDPSDPQNIGDMLEKYLKDIHDRDVTLEKSMSGDDKFFIIATEEERIENNSRVIEALKRNNVDLKLKDGEQIDVYVPVDDVRLSELRYHSAKISANLPSPGAEECLDWEIDMIVETIADIIINDNIDYNDKAILVGVIRELMPVSEFEKADAILNTDGFIERYEINKYKSELYEDQSYYTARGYLINKGISEKHDDFEIFCEALSRACIFKHTFSVLIDMEKYKVLADRVGISEAEYHELLNILGLIDNKDI